MELKHLIFHWVCIACWDVNFPEYICIYGCHANFIKLFSENLKIQWYLGIRPPPFSNNLVFDQKILAKNASEFEQNFDFRTLGMGTEKSRVESKRTPRSISRKRKEPSEAETHSAAPCARSRTALSITLS